MAFIHFFEFSLVGLAALTLVILWIRGRTFEAILFFAAVLVGLSIEILGVKVYRLYFYSSDFELVLSGAPIAIALGWGLLTYCMNDYARTLTIPWWSIAAPAGLIAVCLDLMLDPMLSNAVIVNTDTTGLDSEIINQCMGIVRATINATQHLGIADATNSNDPIGIGVGLWVWCLPADQALANEHLFGVPSANFLSWFTIVAGFIFVRHFFTRNISENHLPLSQQLSLSLKIALSAFLTIVICLLALKSLFYTFSVSGFFSLGVFCALGLFALLSSGKKRNSYSRDLLALGLVFLNTIHCWTAYFLGNVTMQAVTAQIMLFLNLIVLALALWMVQPWGNTRLGWQND